MRGYHHESLLERRGLNLFLHSGSICIIEERINPNRAASALSSDNSPHRPQLKMSGSGLGGLNKSSENSIIIGVCQSQLFDVRTPDQLKHAVDHVCGLVRKARSSYPLMDMIVFPEYCVHGLSMVTDDAVMCTMDGPEVSAFQKACVDNSIWGCFSIMEKNELGMPW